MKMKCCVLGWLSFGQNFTAIESTNARQALGRVVIMSRNSSETSLRIFNSIAHYGLDISRAAAAGRCAAAPYLKTFNVGLFYRCMRRCASGDQCWHRSGLALPFTRNGGRPEQIRIAFDGDAVIFSDEAERIYQTGGIEAFEQHERENAKKPLPRGLSHDYCWRSRTCKTISNPAIRMPLPLRTALVTARSSPAHERVIRTLRAWDIRIDETFSWAASVKLRCWQHFSHTCFR